MLGNDYDDVTNFEIRRFIKNMNISRTKLFFIREKYYKKISENFLVEVRTFDRSSITSSINVA